MNTIYGRWWWPELIVSGIERPVVQVIEQSKGEIVYTVRAASNRFAPPVYEAGQYEVRVGKDKADQKTFRNLRPAPKGATPAISIQL